MGLTAALFRAPDVALMFGDGNDGFEALPGFARKIVLVDFIHFFADGLEGLCYLVAGQHNSPHYIGIIIKYDYRNNNQTVLERDKHHFQKKQKGCIKIPIIVVLEPAACPLTVLDRP
jgi:hypothetical protein